jgi:hypothetical protein
MIDRMRVLGFALMAVLALGAVAASSASAVDAFTSSSGNVVLTGNSVGEPNRFTITGPNVKVECFVANFAGTAQNLPVQEVTLKPEYKGTTSNHGSPKCESDVGEMTVDVNGCAYILTGRTTQIDNGKVDAVVSLECPTGAEMVFTGTMCTIKIPTQTPTSGGVTYVNEGGHITANITATGVTYTSEGAFCKLAGIASEGNTADYVGTVTLFGYADAGAQGELKEGGEVNIEVT